MKIQLFFVTLFFTLSHLLNAGDWTGWRGDDRTDVSEETGLLQSWPEGGPKKVWASKEAGLGYSGFSIANGTCLLYTSPSPRDATLSRMPSSA